MADDSSVVPISPGSGGATRADPGHSADRTPAGRSRSGRPPVIPGYEVRGRIGKGGMGAVYAAVDLSLNRPVALKLLSEDLLARPDHRARFRDEAEAVARLDHPAVVRIFEVGEADGRPYLVLELVPGETLADHLAAAGPLPELEAVALIRALADAVRHAHARGVVHRDLKPANVLLPATGPDDRGRPLRPKLTDFGLARLLDHDRVRTRTGMLLGTPSYMAPEVVEGGHRAVSPAVDVYGLGALLYECLTGRPPADGRTTWETLRQVVDSDPEPPGRARPGLGRAVDAVCLKALAKDPSDRYPSVAALVEDLDHLIAGHAVRARGRGLGTRLARLARRRPRAAAWTAAGVAVAVGLGSLGALYHRERCRDAGAADRLGRELLARGAYAEADVVFARGLDRVAGLPWAGDVAADLAGHRALSRRGQQAAGLHQLVDRLRFGYDAHSLGGSDLRTVVDTCATVWRLRDRFAAAGPDRLAPEVEHQLRIDLLDLALLSADFRVREGGGGEAARRAAREQLDEAERALGPAPVLARIRECYRAAPAGSAGPAAADASASAWDLYTLGRARLNAGDPDGAADLLRRAVDRDPGGFWPNFHAAVCAARRGRYEEAVGGFSACLAVAHDRRGLCHYNRGRAFAGLGKTDRARGDYDRALELEPGLAEAALGRSLLHQKAGRYADAVADLERALRSGYAPAVVNYNLALVYLDAGNHGLAAAHAEQAVRADPGHAAARSLLQKLSSR